jgi:hypothetical protein
VLALAGELVAVVVREVAGVRRWSCARPRCPARRGGGGAGRRVAELVAVVVVLEAAPGSAAVVVAVPACARWSRT